MKAHEQAALDVIRAAYEEPIEYTGAGLTGGPIAAIPSWSKGPDFQGAGATLTEVSFEIQKAALPLQPRKDDVIVHDGKRWSVLERRALDDLDAWQLVVEEAEPLP